MCHTTTHLCPQCLRPQGHLQIPCHTSSRRGPCAEVPNTTRYLDGACAACCRAEEARAEAAVEAQWERDNAARLLTVEKEREKKRKAEEWMDVVVGDGKKRKVGGEGVEFRELRWMEQGRLGEVEGGGCSPRS
ncbi:MAG: hypothetical protein LQ338_001815 [Usnochroma carphineum]|nr:MAG: hypothetical protein LQ338_001815 [Usnochroma carphineum]